MLGRTRFAKASVAWSRHTPRGCWVKGQHPACSHHQLDTARGLDMGGDVRETWGRHEGRQEGDLRADVRGGRGGRTCVRRERSPTGRERGRCSGGRGEPKQPGCSARSAAAARRSMADRGGWDEAHDSTPGLGGCPVGLACQHAE